MLNSKWRYRRPVMSLLLYGLIIMTDTVLAEEVPPPEAQQNAPAQTVPEPATQTVAPEVKAEVKTDVKTEDKPDESADVDAHVQLDVPPPSTNQAVENSSPVAALDNSAKEEGKVTSTAFGPQTISLQSEEQKRAYASGIALATYILGTMEEQRSMHITLDKNIILAGIVDTFANKSLMTEEDTKQTLALFDRQLKLLDDEQKDTQRKKMKVWMEDFSKQDGIVKAPQGILYQIENKGDGPAIKNTDLVDVLLQERLIDGTLIDKNQPQGSTQTFRVANMVPALRDAVKQLRKGGKMNVVIPPGEDNATASQNGLSGRDFIVIYEMTVLDIKIKK